MTVKELKEKLEEFDDSLEVIVMSESDDGGYLDNVSLGEIREESSDIHYFLQKEYIPDEDDEDVKIIGDCCILADL